MFIPVKNYLNFFPVMADEISKEFERFIRTINEAFTNKQ